MKTRQPNVPNNWLADLRAQVKAMTPGEWEMRGGVDAKGDSCDLLMADIGGPEEGDPEYAEVLFGSELGSAEISANWDGIVALRNNAELLLVIAEAAQGAIDSEVCCCPAESKHCKLDALRKALGGPHA